MEWKYFCIIILTSVLLCFHEKFHGLWSLTFRASKSTRRFHKIIVTFLENLNLISAIFDKCSILQQTVSRANHTFYRNFHFTEFAANVLRGNIGSKKKNITTEKKWGHYLSKIYGLGKPYNCTQSSTFEKSKFMRFLFCIKMPPHLEF